MNTTSKPNFFERIFASRPLTVLYYIVTLNVLMILYSVVFQTNDYSGWHPLMWLVVSAVVGLINFEFRRLRMRR